MTANFTDNIFKGFRFLGTRVARYIPFWGLLATWGGIEGANPNNF